jgi:hypothetical protein
METIHNEKYYEKHQEALFEKYRKYCDFEKDLKILMPDFSNLPLTKEELAKAIEISIGITANKIAEMTKADLMKKMHQINEIKNGKACLGYTSRQQEVSEWYDMQEGFEFTCYMLGKFKRKYGIA